MKKTDGLKFPKPGKAKKKIDKNHPSLQYLEGAKKPPKGKRITPGGPRAHLCACGLPGV